MTLNPFIEVARDPVGVFALLGAYSFMLCMAVLGLVYPVRTIPQLWVSFENRRRDQEWQEGPADVGYVPPVGWILMAASVPLFIAGMWWALSALAWLASP